MKLPRSLRRGTNLKTRLLKYTLILFITACLLVSGGYLGIHQVEASSLPAGIVHSVPITLTNTQSLATPTPFQQMITVDSSAYSSYEASNLQNIEFFDSNGAVIPSWLESGNSNTSTNTTYWLKLASGIPANSNITIYIGFASPNINLLNAQTTGEAAQLSSTYGQYDNGANVFDFFDNFSGITLNASKWNVVGRSSYSVNNGLTVTSSATLSQIYSTSAFDGTAEMYGNWNGDVGRSHQFAWGYLNFARNEEADYNTYLGAFYLNSWNGSTFARTPATYSSGTNNIYSLWYDGTNINGEENYSSLISHSGGIPTFPLPITFLQDSGTGITLTSYWVRVRNSPPNGVMPSVKGVATPKSESTKKTASQTSLSSVPSGTLKNPPFVFNGAYATYRFIGYLDVNSGVTSTKGSNVNGGASVKISNVDAANQTFNFTLNYSGYLSSLNPVSNTSASFSDPSPFPAVSQSDLLALNQGQTSPFFSGGTVKTGVSVSVPAGKFKTDEVTTPDGSNVWVDTSSGLMIKMTGGLSAANLTLTAATMELQSTNIATTKSLPLIMIVIAVLVVIVIAGVVTLLMVYGRKSKKSAVAVAETSNPASRLQQLKIMLDKGLITQQDYDEQKRKILEEYTK